MEGECNRIQQVIDQTGPIDFCILGLGKNGHLGFNEPAPFLQGDCHIAKLASTTVQHSMVQTMPKTPTFGMTIGLKDILKAKKILLLTWPDFQKQGSHQKFNDQGDNNSIADLFLWLHSNVECLIDRTSLWNNKVKMMFHFEKISRMKIARTSQFKNP